MNDQDASPEQHLHPNRAAQPSSTPARETTPRSSHDMTGAGAESSLNDTAITTPTSTDPGSSGQRHSRQSSVRDDERRRKGVHRSHRQRASGAFLLTDGIFNPPNQDNHLQVPRRNRIVSDTNSKSKAAQHGQDKQRHGDIQSSGGEGVGLGVGLGLTADAHPRTEEQNNTKGSTAEPVIKRDSLAGDTMVGSSPRTSMASLDMESAQIVNMALNLSESRRLASRRNVTSPAPPRLTPLPDSTTGGSLRQHLQQQRRVSRTISPKPDRTPRIGSGRVLSPLQSSNDPEGSYRYHFSQSTLARAQKAKEYIELMAQYRRVLELLPPLTPSRTARSSTASPPDSPNDSVQIFRLPSNDHEPKIGRPYNPLQYIRNRKVRARERKAIDGEAQGFKDVIKVSEWVDEVAKWVATSQFRAPGSSTLPPYAAAAAADAVGGLGSPPSVNLNKPKRPRVDWVLEPADVIADLYWLEQDGNKRLVEDRHWRRVFPQLPGLSRPLPREEAVPISSNPVLLNESPVTITPIGTGLTDAQIPKSEHESGLTSARDRAQQKLRALKGSHHRQNSSINSRDFLRIHRGSLSESSDTDSDRRRRAINGTISSTGKDILAKQMEALIAREQRDAEAHPLYDHNALRMKFGAELATPEREKSHVSRNPSRLGRHRKGDSRTDLSETEARYLGFKPRPSPPQAVGRASLEVPSNSRGRRLSIDYDTSQPNSPDLRAIRDNALVPAIGMDLSPTSSRPSSPSRNPLARVRSHFRDRSKNRVAEMHLSEVEDNFDIPHVPLDRLVDSPATDRSAIASPERRSSRSPLRKIISRGTDTSHKSYKGSGSGRTRDDGSSGLRSLFRGPRIDSVLRSGVSKVSDIIWRKDSGGGRDDSSSSTSSDESDVDPVRGRPRDVVLPLRRPGDRRTQDTSHQSGKTYLEVMPHFMPTDHSKSTSSDQAGLVVPGTQPTSRPLSRRSSRFELLKPPRLDVQGASPTSSPPPEAVRGSEASDSDSRRSTNNYTDSVRAADARLNAVLQFPQQNPQQFSSGSQWSIPDRRGINSSQRPSTAGTTALVSKREIARLRACLLSTGIHALEIDRRAKQQKLLASSKTTTTNPSSPSSSDHPNPWTEIASLCPDAAITLTHPAALTEAYPLAARILTNSIQSSAQEWSLSSERFAGESAPQLEHRVEQLRGKLAGELTDLARSAAEEADEAYTDLVTGQRLKVKRVVDFIERMARRRRRRFRWVRRAGWLAVEWALVGFMWYVWFVVMIARVGLGVGRGVLAVGRWLLWL